MLDEIALTPDVFDAACYSTVEACDLHLRYLKEPLLSEVLVRNLRNGDWATYVGGETGRWHPRAKELFRKLVTRNRLRPFQPVSPTAPTDDDTWCDEAVASHDIERVAAILSGNDVAGRHAACPVVSAVERATNSTWWRGRSTSLRVPRNVGAYIQHLRLVLANANSLMFIDPHVDPERPQYRNFIQLLLACRRAPPARLEVHRVCYEGPSANRIIYTGPRQAELERRFRDAWTTGIRNAGISVSVYVWPDIHDRFLITDLIGLNVSNGFDESADPNERVTFTRLSKNDADGVQREHDPAVRRPHYVISIP
jgi:hypothetical protein